MKAYFHILICVLFYTALNSQTIQVQGNLPSGSTTGDAAVYGKDSDVSGQTAPQAVGVWGDSQDNIGVYGASKNGIGVYGESNTGYALYANGDSRIQGDLTVEGCITSTQPKVKAKTFSAGSLYFDPNTVNSNQFGLAIGMKDEQELGDSRSAVLTMQRPLDYAGGDIVVELMFFANCFDSYVNSDSPLKELHSCIKVFSYDNGDCYGEFTYAPFLLAGKYFDGVEPINPDCPFPPGGPFTVPMVKVTIAVPKDAIEKEYWDIATLLRKDPLVIENQCDIRLKNVTVKYQGFQLQG